MGHENHYQWDFNQQPPVSHSSLLEYLATECYVLGRIFELTLFQTPVDFLVFKIRGCMICRNTKLCS